MKKMAPEQIRALIKLYDINFVGPVSPSTWPNQYAKVFQKIRDIGREYYEEYGPNQTKGVLEVEETKWKVRELNDIASRCLGQDLDEIEWRLQTEHKIVSRFGEEVRCNDCQKRLWIPDFQALPDDRIDANHLQMRRDRRTLCRCNAASRAKIRAGQRAMFEYRADKPVIYDPSDHLAETGLQVFRPDRVYGLGMTASVERCLTLQPNIRHSPFKDRQLSYPFLIIEAKSEKGGPGFQSIERQTAFPLRTCLKLQEDLADSSHTKLNPLVWFMAYQGDEWRVSAGTVDESEYRIFDLWLGRISSPDHALQLLQIIDYICDWARDIYRPNVLRCLADGHVDPRDLTPALTVYSSQSDARRTTSAYAGSRSSTVASEINPALNDLTDIDEVMQEEVVPGVHSVQLSKHQESRMQHPLLHYSGDGGKSTHWSRYFTVRSSNLVLFEFEHISLPEERLLLSEFLRAFIPFEALHSAASLLLDILLQGVVINIEAVSQLEQLWTQTDQVRTTHYDEPLRASTMFWTSFEPNDWQIIRRLSCITCSNEAARQLATIAGNSTDVPPEVQNSHVHRCPCLCKAALDIRNYSGVDSAMSCIVAAHLCLHFSLDADDERHFEWFEPLDWEHCLRSAGGSALREEVTHSRMLLELLPGKPTPPILKTSLEGDEAFGDADEHSGVVLSVLRPERIPMPLKHPVYCLLVFQDWRYSGGEPWLSEVIAEVVSRGQLLSGPSLIGQDITNAESDMLTCVSRILAGEESPEALSLALDRSRQLNE